MDDKMILRLALTRLDLGGKESLRIEEACSGTDEFLALDHADLENLIWRRFKRRINGEEAVRLAVGDAESLEGNVSLLSLGDPDYPALLKEVYDPPYLLYLKGDQKSLCGTLETVVGSRNASGGGLISAFEIGLGLGSVGRGVVSGLARGIDTAACEGNLAGGGKPVCFLGCGIDSLYPLENRGLAEKIIEVGGVIGTEYPPETPPIGRNFPRRNRILSGLTKRTTVIDVPRKSGALITARFALEEGRDLVVVGRSPGCLALSEEGAPSFADGNEFLSHEEIFIDVVTNEEEAGSEVAIRVEEEVSGKVISYHDKRYTVCDP